MFRSGRSVTASSEQAIGIERGGMVKGAEGAKAPEPKLEGAGQIREGIRRCYRRADGTKRRHAVIPDELKEQILVWADQNAHATQKQLAKAIGVDKGQFNQILVKTRRRLSDVGKAKPSPKRSTIEKQKQATVKAVVKATAKAIAKGTTKAKAPSPTPSGSGRPAGMATEVIYFHHTAQTAAVVEVEVPADGTRYAVIVLPGVRVAGPFEDAVRTAEGLLNR